MWGLPGNLGCCGALPAAREGTLPKRRCICGPLLRLGSRKALPAVGFGVRYLRRRGCRGHNGASESARKAQGAAHVDGKRRVAGAKLCSWAVHSSQESVGGAEGKPLAEVSSSWLLQAPQEQKRLQKAWTACQRDMALVEEDASVAYPWSSEERACAVVMLGGGGGQVSVLLGSVSQSAAHAREGAS